MFQNLLGKYLGEKEKKCKQVNKWKIPVKIIEIEQVIKKMHVDDGYLQKE